MSPSGVTWGACFAQSSYLTNFNRHVGTTDWKRKGKRRKRKEDAADAAHFHLLSHHSQSDTLDKAREADLIQGAQVLAVTALRVANMPELLPRTKQAAEEKK